MFCFEDQRSKIGLRYELSYQPNQRSGIPGPRTAQTGRGQRAGRDHQSGHAARKSHSARTDAHQEVAGARCARRAANRSGDVEV